MSFNPRAREGRDCYIFPHSYCAFCFNPRAREGRDKRRLRRLCSARLFQSTRP